MTITGQLKQEIDTTLIVEEVIELYKIGMIHKGLNFDFAY
jgi:hypothetical protein